jgi:putative ABC transport system substrate-binding protein
MSPTRSAPGLSRACHGRAGNVTGFAQFEYSLSGKWLEVLKQLVPSVRRAAILRDPAQIAGIGQFAVMQAVAPSLGIEAIPINVRDAPEIERTVASFARAPNGGLIVTAGLLPVFHRGLIIKLAADTNSLPCTTDVFSLTAAA